MKNYLSIRLLIAGLLTFSSIKADLTTGTYNVLHAGTKGWFAKEGNWLYRRPGVCNIIKQMHADIYGLQEVIKDNNQLTNIKEALPGYSYVGQPRSMYSEKLWHYLTMSAATDEHNPIFYNEATIELLDSGTFGINTNTKWHLQLLPRICTWALFKEKATNKEFYTYNTHLDNKEQNNRITQIKHILNDIVERCGNKPTILMGDLNTTFVEDMQQTLSNAGFTHARQIAQKAPQYISTHVKGKPFEIDHILVKPKEAFTIKTYNVCGERSETTSDHNPVCMTFSLN